MRWQAKRLRVNVGNVHFVRGSYATAIRMYRMAADALPPGERATRARITQNIAAAHLRIGQLPVRSSDCCPIGALTLSC